MMNTETGQRSVLVSAVRRAVPVLAIAGLLAPVAAAPADAAGTPGARAAQLMRPAGPGLAAVPAGFRPAWASFLSPGSGFVLGGVGCTPGKACTARLVATTDGGARWHVVKAPAVRLSDLSAGGSVSRVVFASARVGWLYGPGLWSTRDGGADWRTGRQAPSAGDHGTALSISGTCLPAGGELRSATSADSAGTRSRRNALADGIRCRAMRRTGRCLAAPACDPAARGVISCGCRSAQLQERVVVNLFDVRIHAIRRRTNRRHPFEVRWHAAGHGRSKSFITRRLADGSAGDPAGSGCPRRAAGWPPRRGEHHRPQARRPTHIPRLVGLNVMNKVSPTRWRLRTAWTT